ncbi:MAG: HAD-IC family P-type ATPase [Patescibacteria group bacterium]
MQLIEKAHSSSVGQVLEKLSVSVKEGLAKSEVEKRFREFGPNKLKEQKKCSALKLFVEQFSSVLVIILIVAGVFSLLIHEVLDAGAIFAIVIINGLMGFVQEYKAEKSLEELQHSEKQEAVVLRDGKEIRILAEKLVPGDILILSEGDRITADARLIKEVSLKVDESMLTGESLPVTKMLGKLANKTGLADRKNMLYSGTVITRGRAISVVVATGMSTQIGKLAHSIQSMSSESTPLQKALDRLGKILAAISLIIAIPGIGFGLILGRDWAEMLMIAVSLAVSVVPEGLPIVVTIALAIGIKKMLKSNVLVRKLSTAESLGGVNVICTDKTGTITHNEMMVKNIFLPKLGFFGITGSGYETKGVVSWLAGKSRQFGFSKKTSAKNLEMILSDATLCSDAQLEIGDPTERALIVAAKKMSLDEIKLREKFIRISELPFSSESKYMAVLVNSAKKEKKIISKGAPEAIIAMCKGSKTQKEKWLDINREMASKGLRVLAIASKIPKSKSQAPNKLKISNLKSLNFIGLVAMYDPPRAEVSKALDTAKKAGIRVIMLTGDHAQTAQAIAKEVGFKRLTVLSGIDIDDLNDQELLSNLKTTDIFARVSPDHKLRILELLQKQKFQVAMIGDGVNDSVSIKRADVGVSVGSGTDLTKSVADMVLLDDNFASIIKGIREARRIFFNIKKFVKFLLSANFDEVLEVLTSILLGLPLSLLPIHILWINLATDSLPALALATDDADEDLMQKKPYNSKKEILHGVISFSVVAAIVEYAFTYGFFVYALFFLDWSLPHLRTLNLNANVLFEFFLLFSVRTDKPAWSISLFANKLLSLSVLAVLSLQLLIVYNPFAQKIFKTTALSATDWLLVFSIAFVGFLTLEGYKWVLRRVKKK